MEEQKEQNEVRIRCNRCRVKLLPSNFSEKRDGILLKSCDRCREKDKKRKESSKCEHGKQRAHCKDCKGSAICEHGKQRAHCKDCKGSAICEHNRMRYRCKDCEGLGICEHGKRRDYCKECSDPIKLTIIGWIGSSRHSDKKYNRYDANNFIDKCFLQGLVEEYVNCYYCTTPLQYIENKDDLATIERIDNTIGHIKSNCVLACRKCNLSCIGDSR